MVILHLDLIIPTLFSPRDLPGSPTCFTHIFSPFLPKKLCQFDNWFFFPSVACGAFTPLSLDGSCSLTFFTCWTDISLWFSMQQSTIWAFLGIGKNSIFISRTYANELLRLDHQRMAHNLEKNTFTIIRQSVFPSSWLQIKNSSSVNHSLSGI